MNFLRRVLPLAGLAVAALSLAGCNVLIPDTGATDPARFVQETAPVFYQPGTNPNRVRPIDAPVPQRPGVPATIYNQSYGIPGRTLGASSSSVGGVERRSVAISSSSATSPSVAGCASWIAENPRT